VCYPVPASVTCVEPCKPVFFGLCAWQLLLALG